MQEISKSIQRQAERNNSVVQNSCQWLGSFSLGGFQPLLPTANITTRLVPARNKGIERILRSWTHLIRFVAEGTRQIHFGQIDDEEHPDLGLAAVEAK